MTNHEREEVMIQPSQADDPIAQLQPSGVINFRLKQPVSQSSAIAERAAKTSTLIPTVKLILALIKHQWQKAIDALMADLTKEPELKLWQKRDRDGHMHWYARDPLNGKSISFTSELELLRWIENLNHRSRW
jgi:hypothetical protein